jgi:voltage-gated potassium channel
MNRRNTLRRILDVALFIATLAAVAIALIESLPDWSRLAALVAFVAMFFVRWWIDVDRMAWMKSNWFDLALVVLLASPVLRMLMALKLVGVIPALKLGDLIRANRERLLRLLILSGESLPAAMAVMFGVVFLFGTSVYLLETGHNAQFGELQDGLWWAFVTLTTVGYGDIVPITGAGRVIAAMTMVLGIAVYSLMIANLTVFIEEYGHKKTAQTSPSEPVQQPSDSDAPSRE